MMVDLFIYIFTFLKIPFVYIIGRRFESVKQDMTSYWHVDSTNHFLGNAPSLPGSINEVNEQMDF